MPLHRRLLRLQSVPESLVVEAFPRAQPSSYSLDAQRPPGGSGGRCMRHRGTAPLVSASWVPTFSPRFCERTRCPLFQLSPQWHTVASGGGGDSTDRRHHEHPLSHGARGGQHASGIQHDCLPAHQFGRPSCRARRQVVSSTRRRREWLPVRSLHPGRLNERSLSRRRISGFGIATNDRSSRGRPSVSLSQ